MPMCRRCHSYYSHHARHCPVCYDDYGKPRLPRLQILANASMPTVGDTYTCPDTGITQTIATVALMDYGATVRLTLADGSQVDIAVADLQEIEPATPVVAQVSAR